MDPIKTDQSQDPYKEGIHVVWHDPTEYDMRKHGPPYLPDTDVNDNQSQAYDYDRR
jgi:hypothetical protein